MKKSNAPIKETTILAVGEIAISLLVVAGYLVAGLFGVDFSYRVITGVLLGSLVSILNFLFLSISVNRAVDSYLALRGTREMTDEEAEKFTLEHSMKIQNTVKTSFIIRTLSILATLIVAFMLDWFDPIATAIPLLAYRPIMSVGELVRKKFDKAPNPENFIYYADPDIDPNEDDFTAEQRAGDTSSSDAAEENKSTKESDVNG